MGTPFAVTATNAFMYYHERDIIELYSRNLTLYKRFIDDIFVIWEGPRETLLQFLSAINTKDERIKITYEISDSKISFLDLLLFKDPAYNKLQYSTFQKPLNKYLYIPYESFHPASNKKAFIKGELMRYARNSSTFRSFSETRQLFWKRLRLRGYPARFLLPIFREINYSNRSKWFSKPKRLSRQRTVVFKSTYNCSHVGIKKVILKHLPNLSSIVSYKSTNTLAFKRKLGRCLVNPNIEIKVREKTTKLCFYTNNKDQVPPLSKSHVVYKFNCPGCQSAYIGKTDRTLFVRTHEHAISDKESAIYKHLRTCDHLIFIRNLCKLPDTLNTDIVPPPVSYDKEYFTQVVRDNTTILDYDNNWNLLLYKEAYFIKRLAPSLNNGLKSSRELHLFS